MTRGGSVEIFSATDVKSREAMKTYPFEAFASFVLPRSFAKCPALEKTVTCTDNAYTQWGCSRMIIALLSTTKYRFKRFETRTNMPKKLARTNQRSTTK